MHLRCRSIPASISVSSLTVSPKMHRHIRSILRSKDVVYKEQPVSGPAAEPDLDKMTERIYSADPGVDRYHLIFTHSIIPDTWSHSLCLCFQRFTQWRESCTLDDIISSNHITMLLQSDLLLPMNLVWMSRKVQWYVDGGLSALKLCCFTTMASSWCTSKCSQRGWPCAFPIFLDYQLHPDWPYGYL